MTHRFAFLHTLGAVLFIAGLQMGIWCTATYAKQATLMTPTASTFSGDLEALTVRDVPQVELAELSVRLQQHLLDGRSIDKELDLLHQAELSQFRSYILDRIALDPDEDVWGAHFEWQSLAALLYHIDSATYTTQLQGRAVDVAKRHFQNNIRAFQVEWGQLPRHFRALALDAYKTLIVGGPGVEEVCAAFLVDIESEIKRMGIDDLRALVSNEQDVVINQITKRRKEGSSWLTQYVKKDKRFRFSRGTYVYMPALKGKQLKWTVEMDTILPGAGYEGFLTFRLKQNPHISTTIRSDAFIEILNSDDIDSLLNATLEKKAAKVTDSEALFHYDLPEKEQSAYLRFLPRSYDSAEFGFLLSSFVRSAALSYRYGKRVSRSDVVFTNALVDSLAASLGRLKEEGITSVIVELASHGVQKGFQYGDTPLSPDVITDLIAAYPEVKFLIRTPACYGGKLRDALLDETNYDDSLGPRVAFFAQSKPEYPNVLYFGATMDASVYDLFMLQNLLDADIKSYGEAAERADRMTRRVYWTHAEAVYQGRLMQ